MTWSLWLSASKCINVKFTIALIVLFLFALVPTLPLLNKEFLSNLNGIYWFNNWNFLSLWSGDSGGSFSYWFVPLDVLTAFLTRTVGEINSVWFSTFLVLLLSSLSCFKLGYFISKKVSISLLFSYVYLYSFYGQYMSTNSATSGSIAFAIVPYFVYIFLSIDQTNWIKKTINLGLASFLLCGVNLAFVAIIWFVATCFVIYRFITERPNRPFFISSFLLSILLYLGVNSVYFFSFNANSYDSNSYLTRRLSLESVDWKSGSSWLGELFRELGTINFYYTFKGIVAYPNIAPYLHSPVLIFSTYSLTILVFIFLFILTGEKSLNRKFAIFMTSLLIFGLFMSMGVFKYSPTKDLYRFVASNIPFFSVFRESYKFMLLINLIYAMVILIGFTQLGTATRRAKWLFFCCLAGVTVSSYQFWSGTYLAPSLIKIPNYWAKIGEMWQQDEYATGKVMLTPLGNYPVFNFTSNRGKHTFFFRYIFNNSSIYTSNLDIGGNPTVNWIYGKKNQDIFPKLLGLIGINKLVLADDYDWELYDSDQPKNLKKTFDVSLIPVKTFADDYERSY